MPSQACICSPNAVSISRTNHGLGKGGSGYGRVTPNSGGRSRDTKELYDFERSTRHYSKRWLHIPQLGFGVFQIESEDTAEAVREAIEVGYRHIDTAEMYGNEREVGEGIRASGIDRGDVFVTSKLNNGLHEPDDAREAFETTLSDLGFDYVDLF